MRTKPIKVHIMAADGVMTKCGKKPNSNFRITKLPGHTTCESCHIANEREVEIWPTKR